MTTQEIENKLTHCSRTINKIIVHCSATPQGRNISASDIKLWHTRDRGFSDIGYHLVVRLDGTIEAGRPLSTPGAHCKGHNAHSIGVCYIGGISATNGTPKDTRTAPQKQSLITLLRTLKRRYPTATIHSHSDFAPKACPCFDATAEYRNL